jgi:hypothetical protein
LRKYLPCLLLLALAAGSPAAREGEVPLAVRIDKAIDRGVAWLKNRADTQGRWGLIGGEASYAGTQDYYKYPAGPTALAVLTLLKCGVSPKDPVVARGYQFVQKYYPAPRSTYETAMIILMIEAKYNRHKREGKRERLLRLKTEKGAPISLRVKVKGKDAAWMASLVKGLLARQNDGKGWRYGWGEDDAAHLHGNKDVSHTQYATLALLVAHRCGIKIPQRALVGTIEWLLAIQEADGPKHARHVPRGSADEEYAPPMDRARGWAYLPGSPRYREKTASGTMTTAGIASILACRKILEEKKSRLLTRSRSARIDTAVLDGLAWLDKHWTVDENPGIGLWYVNMYLYGLERVGDIKRVNLIGRHHWYDEGARRLVGMQKSDGHWTDTTHRPVDVIGTCFALLFLDRATLATTTGD